MQQSTDAPVVAFANFDWQLALASTKHRFGQRRRRVDERLLYTRTRDEAVAEIVEGR